MNRKHGVIMVIQPPLVEMIDSEFKKKFGVERSVSIYRDLAVKTYSKLSNDTNYIIFLSYFFSKKIPDLRWLDSYEPGYIDVSSNSYSEAVLRTAEYALRTGVEKLVWVNLLCPFIEKTDIINVFPNINNKQVVVGHASNGGLYLAGVTQENYKVLSIDSPVSETAYDLTVEKIRKNRLSIFEIGDKIIIKDDDSLKRWVESPEFSMKTEAVSEVKHHRKKQKDHSDSGNSSGQLNANPN